MSLFCMQNRLNYHRYSVIIGTLKAKNNYSGTEYIILDVSLSYKYSLLIKCVFIVILITIVIIVLKKQFGHTGDREL